MNDAQGPQTEAPPPPPVNDGGPPLAFWGVGLALNLLLIVAFVVWALRQGKNRDRRDG